MQHRLPTVYSMPTLPAVRGVDFMSQIPPELLGEIFSYSSLLDPNAPLVLSEVSSSFRRIVRSTPQAWSRLCLSVSQPDMHMDTDARCIRKTELWFSMAAVLAIEVEIQISSAPGPSSDKGRNHTHILISTHNQNLMQQDFQSSLADLYLPQVLRNYNHRIRGLELHTTTVNEAQIFLEAIYPPSVSALFSDEQIANDNDRKTEELPLERLVLHASSDGSRQPLKLIHPRVTTSTPRISLPNLPHLTHLKFHNHPLPYLPLVNVKNLTSLSILYPLRFSPISIYTLLHVLDSTTRLENLEVEGRVMDGFQTPSSPSSPTLTPLSPFFDQHSMSDMTSADSYSAVSPPSLIKLSNLTRLHLRVNNLPGILSHLLLPSLHTLKIDDLDGNRPGAAKQTAEVVRGLLVRMELPCEGRKGKGLQVLDLCNVAISCSGGNTSGSTGVPGHHRLGEIQSQFHGNGHGHAGGVGIDQDAETAETVWAWCFRRMLSLEELVVRNVDTSVLFDIITPKMNGWESSSSRRGSDDPNAAPSNSLDDVSLPSLRKLTIIDQVHNHRTYHHHHATAAGAIKSRDRDAQPLVEPEFGQHYSPPPPSSSSSSYSPSSTLPPFTPSSPHSSSLSPPSSSPPSTAYDSRNINGPILKFQMRRPDVEMVYPSVPVPVERHTSPSPVDFLALYLH